jgi:CrcB protein
MPSEPSREPAGTPVEPDLPRPEPPARPHPSAWRLARERWDLLLVISAGGALGSLARWGLGVAFPHPADRVAWGTYLANVSGALLLGLLMAFMADVWATTRYVRPFLGVGVLGGYTTFSTWMLDTRGLLAAGEPARAAAYLLGTLVVGLVAVWAGLVLGRGWIMVARRRRGRGGRRKEGA